MNVTVTKLTDEKLMQKACSFTISKESKMSLAKIYKCAHSPIRTQLFFIEMVDIPTFVSVHLVRHKIGVEHFVKSNREDRESYSGDAGRLQPVNHAMLINADALIRMARKRLCTSTHLATRELMMEIKNTIAVLDPDLAERMVAECAYRNGLCPELRCCGFNKTLTIIS